MYSEKIFDNKEDVLSIAKLIERNNTRSINIMEVCGTHTMAIAKSGLKQLLPQNIKLVSGPGCPVCVTPAERIDDICKLSQNRDIIIATYGDMIRVPGTKKDISLEKSRSEGANVKIVYSSIDALEIAKMNKNKEIVFLGIGFETTSPGGALAICEARNEGIDNFSVFSLYKSVEPAIISLLESNEVKIDGFLLPGHVAAIIGEDGFRYIEKYNIPGVISGFLPVDILNSIYLIQKQINEKKVFVQNEYTRLVKPNGNLEAIDIIKRVFESCDDIWRGFGIINNSGFCIKDEFEKYDAVKKFKIDCSMEFKNTACRCGDVLKGIIEPHKCPFFGVECTMDSPLGPCMVSSEGSCSAAYKYR